MKPWMKSCLIAGGLILGGWLIVFATATAILRGILGFLDDAED